MQRPTPRELEIRALIREHDRKGLSWAALAEREGISLGTLSWWRSEIRRRDRERVPLEVEQFVEVDVVRPVTTGSASTFELALPDGRVVRIAAGFDPEDLRRLLAVLDAPC